MYYCQDCFTEFDTPDIETRLGGDMKNSQDIDFVWVCPCCGNENYQDLDWELIEMEELE